MHFSETQRDFPRQGNTAVVTCPHCGISRTVRVDRLHARSEPVKVRCSCGPVLGILGELRKTLRKKVQLEGHYSVGSPAQKSGQIVVKNLSKQGVGFETSPDHQLSKGDTLNLTFTLDDSAQTTIEKVVVVKFVKEILVGCAFVEKNETDEAVKNYLKSYNE